MTLWWATGDEASLAAHQPEALSFLEQSRQESGEFQELGTNLEVAILEAFVGNREQVIKHVRRTYDGTRGDAAARSIILGYACKTLAMAGAATEAVECLREALTEPSEIQAFLEPHLPYYDPIREDPEFLELLAEFDQS